jgi:hypothetical protein
MKYTVYWLLIVSLLGIAMPACAAGGGKELAYLTPDEIKAGLDKIAKEHKDIAKIHTLGQSPGGRDILMLELGPPTEGTPAILVVADMEGNSPIATKAAYDLAGLLVSEWKDDLTAHRWYIMPVGNPDGYAHYFSGPLYNAFGNDRPVNDDNDDAVDEDGPDDLNGDGYITMMRQAHPEGKWIPVEGNPVLMKQADVGKGETGQYRLIPEGIDNDGDGKINEDGPGGANPGHNFPHNFEHYTTTDGMYPGSEPESRAILQFASDHQDIAMVLVFGRSNSLKNVPEASRKAEATGDKYKLPKHMAEETGIDPEAEFTMDQLVEMGKEFTGYQDLTPEMVLQFLGVGAAMSPDANDLAYWNEISKRYNDFIKEAGMDAERLKPPSFSSGSIDEWAYFQYGVPTFSLDFWTVPVTKKEEPKTEGMLSPDEVEKMSNEEFIALGPEKIGAFLKASNAPAQFTPEMVIMGLQGGMVTTKKMAEFMREGKKKEEAGGADATEQALFEFNPSAFVSWQPYDHPTLGKVEIGGMIPYSTVAISAADVAEKIQKQIPFVRQMTGWLPKVTVEKVDIARRAPGIWKVDVWIANTGFLPFPTYQGERCQRPSPAVASIDVNGITLLEGKTRVPVGQLAGSGGYKKVSWLIDADDDQTVTIRVSSFSAGADEKTVTLKEEAQ